MIKSMTGYGKGEYVGDNRKYIVEIKSVNHRYLDFNIKLPRSLSIYEDNIKRIITKKISRGKIDVSVRFENFSDIGKNIKFDDELLKQYLSEFNRVSKEYNIENDLKLSNLSNIEALFKIEQSEEDEEILLNELSAATENALNNFVEMRSIEGEKISQDIFMKLDELQNNIDEIEKISLTVVDEYKTKIEARLKDYIDANNIDNNRILTEIIIFADKMTIDEEIIRFKSHINQFRKELNNENAVGKKLDFITQELNRETNTIGSKTNSLDITNYVILNKSILENIREQIQNIE